MTLRIYYQFLAFSYGQIEAKTWLRDSQKRDYDTRTSLSQVKHQNIRQKTNAKIRIPKDVRFKEYVYNYSINVKSYHLFPNAFMTLKTFENMSIRTLGI